MSDSTKPVAPVPSSLRPRIAEDDKVVCERCGGGNVYRMHAVWRCADCGYKTDCCGW
jgi:ribosomal protein L37AE/L43A